MNIKRAKQEIKNTIQVYLTKNAHGEYEIPSMRQRPVLLIGPPGIGKTQIMEQVAREFRASEIPIPLHDGAKRYYEEQGYFK